VNLTPASDSSSASLILEYPRPSKNDNDANPIHTLTPTATLVECGEGCSPVKDVTPADIVEFVANNNLVDVQERETALFLEPIPNVYATNNFGVVGRDSPSPGVHTPGLVDTVCVMLDCLVKGIPAKLIEFEEGILGDGTTVEGGDTDAGDSLTTFSKPVKFVDFDSSGTFNVNELLYEDVNDDDTVNLGDRRIANHPAGATGDGTIVAGTIAVDGDADVGDSLVSFVDGVVKFVNVAPSGFDVGELLYEDVGDSPPSGDVDAGDRRIANHPAALLSVFTHNGLTITDDIPIVIDAGVAKLNLPTEEENDLGSRIQTPYLPGFVALTIDNLGGRDVELLITDGVGDEFTALRSSPDMFNPYRLTVTDPQGIKEIQFIEIRKVVGIADPLVPEPIDVPLHVSSIETFGDVLQEIDVIDFDLLGVTSTSQTFDVGFFFSESTAQRTPALDLPVRPEIPLVLLMLILII